MPWQLELMKDATNGETLRGVVSTQRSGDIRMRKLNSGNALLSISKYIAYVKATQ
jgi:hypothetical protein